LKQREQDVRSRIVLDVQTSVAQLASARSEVDVARMGIDLARQEVEQARDRFQAGVANSVEVVTGAGRSGARQRQPDRGVVPL
jgi:outer membrane protein TolC